MTPAPRNASPTTVVNAASTSASNNTNNNNVKSTLPLTPLPDHYLVQDDELGPCLHGLFRRQAEQTPDRIALASLTKSVTYQELNHATDQLAFMLMQRGVSKNDSVGILMERRNEYALAYIAIHKAGGGYLPLDPAYPKGLLQDVLENSQPTVVICTQSFQDRLPQNQTVIVLSDDWNVCLDSISEEQQQQVAAVDQNDLDSLAYIVYSSGTTGKPKGIACPHRGSVYSYQYRLRQIPYLEDEENNNESSVIIEKEGCNVFFVWEMLRPLLRGQTLVVIPDNVIYDPLALANFCDKLQITRMLFTPSLLEAVLDAHGNASKTTASSNDTSNKQDICGKLACLKTITLCGEVVTVSLQERTKKLLPNARIWNLYSVSECHDVAALELTHGKYGSRKYCPVGKLMEGVEAHVMEELPDGTLAKKAMGEVGELYVAGPTLAREYVKMPELTGKRFPTVQGTRLYKTGDRARVLPNRELEILGRCDSMVKVRGYSVELRAIEAAVMTLTDLVSSCSVIVQGDEGEDKFVIAYVVLANAEATCRKVRLALKAKLPHYMVPAFLVDMEELPTHEVSGKLDKKALPPVDLTTGQVVGRTQQTTHSDAQDCTVPRNETESRLHSLWCEIMSMKQIDVVFDSFFDIGGHSLLAARLVQRISAELEVDVGVVELFSHATIEALASLILQKQQKTTGNDTALSGPAMTQRTINLEEEVMAHDTPEAVNDIAMRAFWRSTHFRQVLARSVLMTGATGFLGSWLLHNLLQDNNIDVVYCLVRATSNAEAASRLQQAMQERQLWDDDYASRVQVFAADTSLHHMGLDDDDYAMLGTGVDMVVHCAAHVNLVYPYEGLRSANVQGTGNVIEFALYGRVKKLAYISTDAVFPDGLKECREDADMMQYAKPLSEGANGYSQTKWVAEMLVNHAKERGLPTVIFRPGNMGGVGAVWNPSDFNFLVLQGCIAVGAAPVVDGWIMESTPVDFAASAMVKLMVDRDNLGEAFHVTNFGNCHTANEYFDALRGAGVALESCSLEEWNKRVLATESPDLNKLRNAIMGGATASVSSMSELSTLNNEKFAAKCDALGTPVPKITLGVMRGYLKDWRKAGLVASISPKNTYGIMGKPLAGKVAVVTGASSGIGAAIAQALSLAGAKVGIGGRRLDRLKDLASQLTDMDGVDKVHPCKVDVTSREEMETFCKDCEAALGGPIDIFVNNAGVMFYGRLEAMREEQWHKELDVNCKGLLHATACVLPGMLTRGSGHIVVTSSDAGRKVFPGLANYSATKFFVEAFCQGMRLENADKGLKVTTIQPGDCRTELSQLTTDQEARNEFAQSSQDREFWLDPQDVAGAVLYAVTAPKHVGVNEVLIEPRGAPA
ncbi:D-alanine--D-alanyl carrier protein ligase [Seminavis robusta]|uniref:D-alanine--D-alanyl carrier protein ligase n=1 Tax=Seminavis robusta TaxID=568900 RepID=A0A9N8DNM4_9STRA|nr:D-alanine--D-alanyl carrier protein ligase [Seminavis robusta]|eukprot:Sro248_g098340.1 D-alanine--D-alanyl carrier protein ligase (1361) ;mRNA; r:39645-43727